MTKRTFNQIKQSIANLLPDNVTGQISAQDVRDVLLDLINTLEPAYSYLKIGVTPVLKVIGTTPVVLVGWATSLDSDPSVSVSDKVAGVITRVQSGVARITFQADALVAGNREVTFQVYIDGQPTGWVTKASGVGTSDVVTVNLHSVLEVTDDSQIDVRLFTNAAGTNVTLTNTALICEYVPVRGNP